MKINLILILLFFCTKSFAQKTEKYYDVFWKECTADMARFYSTVDKTDSGYTRVDYYLNNGIKPQMIGKYKDENCKIKDGYFIYYFPNGNIDSYVKYINGEKEGLYISFHYNGMMKDSTIFKTGKAIGTSLSWHSNGYISDSCILNNDGLYTSVSWFDNGTPSDAGKLNGENNKHGTWQFFNKMGDLTSKEIYNNGKYVNAKYYDKEKKITEKDSADAYKDASFKGGIKKWQKYLTDKLRFPENYKLKNSSQVTVVVTFTVTEEGSIDEVFISTPFAQSFDTIAENIIKESPKWVPAKSHNRNVRAIFRQPVSFAQIEQ